MIQKFIIVLKLCKIAINVLYYNVFNKINYSSCSYILSVDSESKFINKVELDEDSFEKYHYQAILELLKFTTQKTIKAVFFINYPELFVFPKLSKAVKSIHKQEHQIGVHIHPSLINKKKSPDLSAYSKIRIKEMLEEGKKALFAVTNENPIVFRAGGYSVGNWSKIYESLVETGFQIDSSIFPGAKNLHQSKFDFVNCPHIFPYPVSPNNFRVSYDASELIEYPITTVLPSKNNQEAYYFRFDPRRHLFLLKLYVNFLVGKYDSVCINIIFHTKEVYDSDGNISRNYKNLTGLINFLENKGLKNVVYSNKIG